MKKNLIMYINEIIYVLLYNIIDFSKENIRIKDIKEINTEYIKKLKSEHGIGGIILDVDNTIKRPFSDISECNKKWIEAIKKEFRIVFVSNGNSRIVKKFSEKIGVKYISFAKKPKRQAFLDACENMGLDSENVLVIGNSIIADIFGGNRSGTVTAKTKGINKGRYREVLEK